MQFNDVVSQLKDIKQDIITDIEVFLDSGNYIYNNDENFYNKFVEFCELDTKALGCSSGTSGLQAALLALKYVGRPNVVVYIPDNTFMSAYYAAASVTDNIVILPVNQDRQLDFDSFKDIKIDKKKNNILILTYMYGITSDITEVVEFCDSKNITIIEDCSQAHGLKVRLHGSWVPVGSVSPIAVFSCYPGKLLGAAGDAGLILSDEFYSIIKKILNNGDRGNFPIGINGRIQPIQEIILKHKLPYLREWNKRRNEIGYVYYTNIDVCQNVPVYSVHNTYHIYPVYTDFLNDKPSFPILHHYLNTISEVVGRPKCNNKLPPMQYSIPIHPFMTESEVNQVIEEVNKLGTK